MSIQNKRIALLTDIILKQNLQKGILPDSREFIWQLNQALRDSRYDEPSFVFRAYRNTEIATSAKMNTDNERIYQDLNILYLNIAFVHQLLNKYYQNFSIEKDKLEKEIDVLENRLRQYIQNANRSGLLPYAYDTFDTTEKSDLLETSHVFIDTTNNAVHLVEEKNTSTRLYPAGTTSFVVYPNGIDKKEEQLTGKLENILTDKQDETWQRQVLLKENRALTGQLSIQFEVAHALNRIEMEAFTVKPFQLRVTFTPNGTDWYHLPYHEDAFEVSKRVALDFPSVDVLGLRLSLEKAEADESLPETEDYDYQYLFGLQTVSFYCKQYPSEGLFVTNALPLMNAPENYAIDEVQLHVDEWVPTGTAIEYEIAVPDTEGNKDWQRIDPMGRKNPESSQVLYFSRLTRNGGQSLYFPENFSIRQSEAEDLLRNGIPLYRLSCLRSGVNSFEMPKVKILEGSTRLYAGKNSWEVTSFPSAQTTSAPILDDFKIVQDKTVVDYTPLSNARTGEVMKNRTDDQTKKYLARLGFYLEEARAIQATPVSTEPIAIYSNGELLFRGETTLNETVSYVFNAGWNELVVLVNGKNATSVNGMTVSIGFNPATLTDKLYASSKPLKEISLFDLQYNTKMNDRSVFSKRETPTGLEILTNFGKPGLQFDLLYDYKDDDYVEEESIFLRARFLRDNGENIPTPILRSYRLEFS